MKRNQFEVIRKEVEIQNCPLCDGCNKMITGNGTFYKWFARESGEDAWNDGDFDIEFHSHKRATCVGKVMAGLFEVEA